MTRNRLSAKQAGTAFETLMARYFAHVLNDDRVERRARNGANDRGDLSGLRIHGQRLVAECKNTAKTNLAGWMAETHLERGNDDALAGFIIHKRHGVTDPAQQWVTTTAGELAAIINGHRNQHDD